MKGQTLLTHHAFTMPSCHWSTSHLTLGSLGLALSQGSLRASAAPPCGHLLRSSLVSSAAASQELSCKPSCEPSCELSHELSCVLPIVSLPKGPSAQHTSWDLLCTPIVMIHPNFSHPFPSPLRPHLLQHMHQHHHQPYSQFQSCQ